MVSQLDDLVNIVLAKGQATAIVVSAPDLGEGPGNRHVLFVRNNLSQRACDL